MGDGDWFPVLTGTYDTFPIETDDAGFAHTLPQSPAISCDTSACPVSLTLSAPANAPGVHHYIPLCRTARLLPRPPTDIAPLLSVSIKLKHPQYLGLHT